MTANVHLFTSLAQAILSLVVVYILALYLRRKGVLDESHSLVLARIVTELCLPAVVFYNLATTRVALAELQPAFVMLGAEIASPLPGSRDPCCACPGRKRALWFFAPLSAPPPSSDTPSSWSYIPRPPRP